MARWQLNQPHYLNIDPPTEWEHREIDQETGRSGRKVYEVPQYLDTGTIVCDGKNAQRGDTIFLGPPTPDMDPLDDEARAISEEEGKNWTHPIESLPINFSQSPIPMDVPPPPKPTARRV